MKHMNGVKASTWLIEGISESQLLAEKTMAHVAGEIGLKRVELGMDQKTFAKYMGVSQGMVSRWESGMYNFTLTTLTEICDKLGLSFSAVITEKNADNSDDCYIIRNDFCSSDNNEWSEWVPNLEVVEGGAA